MGVDSLVRDSFNTWSTTVISKFGVQFRLHCARKYRQWCRKNQVGKRQLPGRWHMHNPVLIVSALVSYDMIYLSTAIGLTPGGSVTVHTINT